MATRGNILEIMNIDEVFSNYIDKTDYRNSDRIGEMLFWSLKNDILEGKLEKLVGDVEDLREKVRFAGERE